jgi:hypothetical protein
MKKASLILLITVVLSQLVFSQTNELNSFLGIKLGTSLKDFLLQNPESKESTFWVLHTEINTKGMIVHKIKRSTSSGDKVQIDCCFYKEKLSVIGIEYSSYQSGKDIYGALKGKYGESDTYDVISWRDFTNGQNRTTETFYWNTNKSILNFLYTKELGLAQLIFADKVIQQKIKIESQKNNRKKIE